MPPAGRRLMATPPPAAEQSPGARLPSPVEWTSNRSATRPDPLHPMHRHDVGRARAPDRTELEHVAIAMRQRQESRRLCRGLLLARSPIRLVPRPEGGATTQSQPVEESEEGVGRAVAAGLAVQRLGAGQCSLLEREVGVLRYICVVSTCSCPSHSAITVVSTPACSSRIAAVWRRTWCVIVLGLTASLGLGEGRP